MAISLTESAANRVKSFLASRGHGIGLRLGVRKTGCSGFAYVINYADEPQPGDVVFEDRGVKVFVDAGSLGLLDGTIVDFVKQGLNEAFRFSNPNVKGECGCGESFSRLSSLSVVPTAARSAGLAKNPYQTGTSDRTPNWRAVQLTQGKLRALTLGRSARTAAAFRTSSLS